MQFFRGIPIVFLVVITPVTHSLPDFGVGNYECENDVMRKSKSVPINVNSVRPADINVVMALGDSLTAGNGAAATNVSDVILQYRGLSFGAGGDGSIENHVTIPNILKKYNANLFGYSKGIGSQNIWSSAQLNAAVPGAHASHLPGQARQLISLLQQHNDLVNMKEDWKLLNIFIGANDICDYCINSDDKPSNDVAFIKEAIQLIMDNVPRVIVSLTSTLHLEMLRQIEVGNEQCAQMHKKECHCVNVADTPVTNLTETINEYNRLEMELQTSGYFERDDFTVIIQPFFSNTVQPPVKNGQPDLTFFAPDCFHFSQLGHSIVSTHLWKNIMSPVAAKQNQVNITNAAVPLSCPDLSCPFIRTVLNSNDCTTYLMP